jgi:hypothetical protein
MPEEITRQVVRLCERASEGPLPMIDGVEFEDCEILGPAIVVPLDTVAFESSSFDGPPEAWLWEVPPDRPLVGVIGLTNVRFYKCRFRHVGIAAPAEIIEQIRSNLPDQA